MKIGSKKTWIGVFFLIAIEQFIKIIINNNFLDKKFAIFPPVLYFEPMFNRRYSWINSMLQLDNGKWIHIIAVSIMTILLCLFYHYLNKEIGNSKIINIMFAFIFSGAICSLIDKIFWNGSLDYIFVNGLFTFDLKDVYINIFSGLLIFLLLFNNKTLKQMDDKNIFKGFTEYILGKS
jgi:signal peptidase II